MLAQPGGYFRRPGLLERQAANGIDDLDVAFAHILETLLKSVAQRVGASHVARHVCADARPNLGRRCQMEMRIEIGDTVNLKQGDFRPVRESLQLIRGKVSVLSLDGSKIVEDQTNPSVAKILEDGYLLCLEINHNRLDSRMGGH